MKSLIQEKISSGQCVLYKDYRSGCSYNWDGNAYTNSYNGTVTFNKEGVQFGTESSSDQVDDNSKLRLTAGTIVVFSERGFFTNNLGVVNRFVSKRDAGGSNYDFGMSSINYIYYDGTLSRTKAIGTTDGSKYLGIEISHGSIPVLYINGVLSGSFNGTSNVVSDDADLLIGALYSSGYSLQRNTLSAVLIFNSPITATEHAQIYAELLAMKWPLMPYTKGFVNTLPNVSETGLVGAWDLKPINNTIVDSTTIKNGTIGGCPAYENSLLGNVMNFDGVDDYINIGNTSQTVKGVAFSFYNKAAISAGSSAATLIGLQNNNNFAVSTGSVTGTLTNEIITVLSSTDGRDAWTGAGTLPIGWHRLVCSFNETDWDIYLDGVKVDNATVGTPAAITADDVILAAGKNSGTVGRFSNVKMNNVSFYSSARSASWVADDYKKFARAVQFKTDWGAYESDAAVSAGFIENTPFNVLSGTWKIVTTTLNGSPVKALQCVTDGAVNVDLSSLSGFPKEDLAYGTYDFWMYKGSDASLCVFSILNENALRTGATVDGYSFYVSATESISIGKITNGSNTSLSNSDASYVPVSTWLNLKLTRDYVGSMSYYYNGVLVTPASEKTNPYADTSYTSTGWFNIELDAGDMVSLGNKAGNYALTKYLGDI